VFHSPRESSFKSGAKQTGRTQFFTIAFAAVLIGLFALVCGAWFVPVGMGEYRESPDGLFTAHVSNVIRGTWTSRIREVRIRVIRNDGLVLIDQRLRCGPNDTIPDYSDRSQRFIQWNEESTVVTVRTINSKDVKIELSAQNDGDSRSAGSEVGT
jgi:hypothetical protein